MTFIEQEQIIPNLLDALHTSSPLIIMITSAVSAAFIATQLYNRF